MSWTWVRPVDSTLLDGRPLLDLGTGDAATLGALVADAGLVVGLDASPSALRAARHAGVGRFVAGRAEALPFGDASFAVVVAGDLFHHLDDEGLVGVLAGIRHALRPDGHLVAWWYASPGRPGPDVPAHPRPFETVAEMVERAGFAHTRGLALELTLEPAPATAGLVARR